jgi:hypothetical protein
MNSAYFDAVRKTLHRHHSPGLSPWRLRRICRCGTKLTCPVLRDALIAVDRSEGRT